MVREVSCSIRRSCRLQAVLVVCLSLGIGVGSAMAGGEDPVLALHAGEGYRSPGTASLTCQFAYPTNRTLLALLWRPQLPAGWVLAGVAGEGMPQTNGTEIVFTGELTNNPVMFAYDVHVPAGQTGSRNVGGEVEYTLSGEVNFSTVQVQPAPLIVGQIPEMPQVENIAATNVMANSAVVRGNLVSQGVPANTQVQLYYGMTDAGTNAGAWASSADLGGRPTGLFSYGIGSLKSNAVYYFRCAASNAAGTGWAPASATFTTPFPPMLGLSASVIPASVLVGLNPASNAFEVWNAGAGALSYSLSRNATWFSLAPAGGTSTGEHDRIVVSYAATNLAPGYYTAQIAAYGGYAPNSPQTVSLTLTVLGSLPSLQVDPTNLMVAAITSTDTVSRAVRIWNGGAGALAYVISNIPPWCSVAPVEGLSTGQQDTITVTCSAAGLATGSYSGVLWILSPDATNSPRRIPVTLSVYQPPMVETASVSNVTPNSAVLRGNLVAAGWPTGCQVRVYYGSSDGGDLLSAWSRVVNVGSRTAGPFSGFVAGLASNTPHYYRCWASNAAGIAWAPVSVCFTTLPPATIGVSTTALSRVVPVRVNPAPDGFDIRNTGPGTLSYSISDNLSWLSVSPAAGTSTGEVDHMAVSYACTNLVPGVYTGQISIACASADNSPRVISVCLTVLSGPPVLQVDPTNMMRLVTTAVEATNLTFRVWNSGYGSVSYTVSNAAPWFSVSPAEGVSTGEQNTITVTCLPSALGTGTFSGVVWIVSPDATNSPCAVPVELMVKSPPSLMLSTSLITRTAVEGTRIASDTFRIWNSGYGQMVFSLTTDTAWAWANPAAGSSTGDVKYAYVNYAAEVTNLVEGVYTTCVMIASAQAVNAPRTLPVVLRVTPRPRLALDSLLVTNDFTVGSLAPGRSFRLWNAGSGSFSYSLTDSASWLSVWPTNGVCASLTNTITVLFETAGLTAGLYTGTISVAANGAADTPRAITVVLDARGLRPVAAVTPARLEVEATAGQSPVSVSVRVRNAALSGVMTYALTPEVPWLTAVPGSGVSTGQENSVEMRFDPASLLPGIYTGGVVVASVEATNTPLRIPAFLRVTPPPALWVSTNMLEWAVRQDESASNTITICNSGGGILAYTLASDVPWAASMPVSGSSTGELDAIRVVVSTGGVAAGRHEGRLTILAPGTTGVVDLICTVWPRPVLAVAPAYEAVGVMQGSNAPPVSLSVWNAAPPESLAYRVSASTPWLQCWPPDGVSTGEVDTVQLSFLTAGMNPGTYTGLVMVVAPLATNIARDIPVILTVMPQPAVIAMLPEQLESHITVSCADPVSQSIEVWNAGVVTGSMAYAVTVDVPWLSVEPGEGVSYGHHNLHNLTMTNLAGLALGKYSGHVVIASDDAADSRREILVTLVVEPPPPSLAASSSRLVSSSEQGQGAAPQVLSVWNASGTNALSCRVASTAPWLVVEPGAADCTAERPAVFTNRFLTAALPAGEYDAALVITAAGATNSPLVIDVHAVVLRQPAVIGWDAGELTPVLSAGADSAVQQVSVWNAGTGTMSVAVSADAPWMTVTPAEGVVTGAVRRSFTVAFQGVGLAEGVHTGCLTIAAAGAVNTPVSVPVYLTVRPVLAIEPSFVVITAGPGTPPGGRIVQLWNAGTANPVAFTAFSHAAWLTVTTTNGTSTGSVTGEITPLLLGAETAGLRPGVYHAAVDITPDATPAARQRLMVQLVVTAEGGQFAEKVVFDSGPTGNSDIWMVNPDGSGLTTLVVRAGNQVEPRPSPDGLKLAYRDVTANRLMVLDLVTRTEQALTNVFGYDWLPDSSGLVGQGSLSASTDVWLVPLDGPATPLFIEGDRQGLVGVDWTSGRTFYTTDPGTGSNTEVKVYDPVTAGRTVVIPRDGCWRGQGNVSRDGLSLCYAKAPVGQPPGLFVVAADGTAERRVTGVAGVPDAMPDFSPDGHTVVFQRQGALWTVAAGGISNPPVLLVSGSTNNWPAWSVLFLREREAPVLALESRAITNSVKQGMEPDLGWIEVRNAGNGTLTFAVSNAIPWLRVSPVTGSSTGEISHLRCDFRSAGLEPGAYTGTLALLSNASNALESVSLTLMVLPPDPVLVCDPQQLSNVGVQGESAGDQTFRIWNGGGGLMDYSLTSNVPWLTFTPVSGGSTGETDIVTVHYHTAGFTPGATSAVILVASANATNAPLAIPVEVMTVAPRSDPAILAVAPVQVSAALAEGVSGVLDFEVWNAGATVLTYQVTCAAPWIDVMPVGGTSQGEHDRIEAVCHTDGLMAGTNNATIEVMSEVGTQTVWVALVVLPPPRFHLSVQAYPVAGGSVGLSPGQPGNGYARGTVVTLLANNSSGYLFSHWAGSVSATNRSVEIVMDSEKAVIACFSELTTLAGYLTNTVTGARVSGAVVEFGKAVAVTGPAGSYSFAGVDCAPVLFRASRVGYRSWEELYAPPCYTNITRNLGLTPAFISNVRAAQRAGTRLVEITYDLEASADDVLPVTLELSSLLGNSWNLRPVMLTGDLGSNVVAGLTRRIIWDAGADLPGFVSTQMMARVSAGGSLGLTPAFRLNTREQSEWSLRAWNDRSRNSRFDPGESLAGVEVFYDGRTASNRVGVTDTNGQLRVFVPLQQGRILFARKVVTSTRSPKAQHGAVSGLLNVTWQDSDVGGTDSNAWDGVWRSYVVSEDDVSRSELGSPVYLKLEHTLTEWNLLVASEVNSLDFNTRLKAGFEQASAYLYDVTDGQAKLGSVVVSAGVVRASSLWTNADVVILAQADLPPWAMLNGSLNPAGGCFRMGTSWKGAPPDEPAWFRTFIRQFCAYTYGLAGEDADGSGNMAAWRAYRLANPDKIPVNYGVMDDPVNSSELSAWHKYLPAYPDNTNAAQVTQQIYNRLLRTSKTYYPCWQWLELQSQRAVSDSYAEIVVPVRGYYLGGDSSTSDSRPGPWYVPAPYEVCQVTGDVPPSSSGSAIRLKSSASGGARGVVVSVLAAGCGVPRAAVYHWSAQGVGTLSGYTDAAGQLTVYNLAEGDRIQALSQGQVQNLTLAGAALGAPLVLEFPGGGLRPAASGAGGSSSAGSVRAVVSYVLQASPRVLRVTVQVDRPLVFAPEVACVLEDGTALSAAMNLVVDGVYAGDIPLGLLSAGTVAISCAPVDGDASSTVDAFDIRAVTVADGTTVYSSAGRASVFIGPAMLSDDTTALVIEDGLPPILPTGVGYTNAVLGGICVVLPDNVTAAGAGVTLNVTYDETALAGLDESTLRLYLWDQAARQWTEVAATLASDVNTISALINSSGTYAVFADLSIDVTAPAQITDLVATSGDQPWTVRLTWTAPGDDGGVDQASRYLLKFGLDPVTNWDTAAIYPLPLTPGMAGAKEKAVLPMPDPNLLYAFAIAARDEAGNIGSLSSSSSARSQFVDADQDGIPDDLETVQNSASPAGVDLDSDPDHDGMTTREEYAFGTDPFLWDTDGDGMGDGWEREHGLFPTSSTDGLTDDDHDGVCNRDEYRSGADPHNADSDGDGVPDGWEMVHGLDSISGSGINGGNADPDMDGFSNINEYTADSDPLDARSNLIIDSCLMSADGLRVKFTSSTSREYDLWVSTNLTSRVWIPLQVNRPGAGVETVITDTDVSRGPRFYKVEVRLP